MFVTGAKLWGQTSRRCSYYQRSLVLLCIKTQKHNDNASEHLATTLESCPASGAPWSSAMSPSLGRGRVNNKNNNSTWLSSNHTKLSIIISHRKSLPHLIQISFYAMVEHLLDEQRMWLITNFENIFTIYKSETLTSWLQIVQCLWKQHRKIMLIRPIQLDGA